jgi:hypothetical protein
MYRKNQLDFFILKSLNITFYLSKTNISTEY